MYARLFATTSAAKHSTYYAARAQFAPGIAINPCTYSKAQKRKHLGYKPKLPSGIWISPLTSNITLQQPRTMALQALKIFLCLSAGLIQYLFQVLPNIWLLWNHLEIASYPHEALYGANSLEASVAITAAAVLALMSAGWYIARDSAAPFLAMLSLVATMSAEILFHFKGDFISVTYGLLFLMLALEIAFGSPKPKTKKARRGWYKHSMVKKEFCLAAVAVLISLSYRAQPTCYAKLGREGFGVEIDAGATGEFALGGAHEVVVGKEQVVVREKKGEGKVLFESQAGQPFVVSARGGVLTARNEQEMSLFDFSDSPEEFSKRQSVEKVESVGEGAVVLHGQLFFASGKVAKYNMTFEAFAGKAVKFAVEQSGVEALSRTYLVQASEKDESVFGMGIQFTYFNLKGGCVPVFTQEQGKLYSFYDVTPQLSRLYRHWKRVTTAFVHSQPRRETCARILADYVCSCPAFFEQPVQIFLP